MPHPSRTCTSLCSLAVALALVALATIINAKDSHHLLSHHQQQHPPQHQQQPQQHHIRHDKQHHHHDPTLAGALFPFANDVLAGKKEYVKEPCPTGCVHHRSDVYLAVTSIGEGFPRVQFTCSHAHPFQSTATAEYHEGNHYHYLQHHTHHGQGINVQEPADPIPEHTPHAPSHGCSKCNHHDSHDQTDSGANVYTDLHPTADPHLRGSTPMDYNNKPIAAGGFYPHYDFSPRESHSADFNDNAESHTTTLTFSDDNSDHIEHIASAERRSIPLTVTADDDQDPHHQRVHILPANDHNYDHHVHHGAALTAVVEGFESTTPEPIATLAAPTSSNKPGSGPDRRQGMDEDRTVSKGAALYHDHEYKAGPAAPIPEAFPSQTKGHTQAHDHHKQGDASVGGRETATGQSPVVRYRTIVHRVTTLIIETETIVNRPTSTSATTAAAPGFMQGSRERDGRAQQHYHHNSDKNKKEEEEEKYGRRDPYAYGPHVGDHVMFDAGVEGEMVVSIASSDQTSRRHNNNRAH